MNHVSGTIAVKLNLQSCENLLTKVVKLQRIQGN